LCKYRKSKTIYSKTRRVLSLHKDKTNAVIHDLVVVPRINPEAEATLQWKKI
jgi:hypothetical protein